MLWVFTLLIVVDLSIVILLMGVGIGVMGVDVV